MKLAFIVPRYGPDILDGAEHACRLIAERLASQHDVEVLTTCARDATTWRNVYPEGSDRVRGVTVRRFATARTRDAEAFDQRSAWILDHAHTREDERDWLQQQGPWCPSLIEQLRRNQQQYDALVFFTHLSATTVVGLEVNPAKSILVSTAQDLPATRLQIYSDVFSRPAALCYFNDSERQFVQGHFADRPLIEEVIGIGVEIPPPTQYPRMPASKEDAEGTAASESEGAEPREFATHLLARGSVFRRRHRLHGPIVLYAGRIEPAKGCEELLEYFASYIKDGGDATLALMGIKLMSLPEDPTVRFAGLLSDRERVQALEAATVVVCPSPHETLSIVALESLAVGTPILVNARSSALVEHASRSNGGLWYADGEEFTACLKLLTGDAALREAMGRNGREHVRRNHRWDVVLGKLERVFSRVRNAK
jgi:glycosyltransferase involved in cell wall biosynthesis